jgi:hypothetical protein
MMWPRRCLHRRRECIQCGRENIDRQIAEAQAQNGGGPSKPGAVTDLQLRCGKRRPEARVIEFRTQEDIIAEIKEGRVDAYAATALGHRGIAPFLPSMALDRTRSRRR